MIDFPLPILVAFLATVVAAAMDLRRFRIANRLSLTVLLTGLAYGGVVGGLAGLGASLAGALFGFGLLILPYSVGGMGAGDVKLAAGLGAWLGMAATFEVIVAAFVATVVYALVVVVASGRLAEALTGVRSMMANGVSGSGLTVGEALKRPDRRSRLVPFAAMLCVGVIASAVRLGLS